ncbi:MAG TPA: DUF3343 domain-containing protein [Victivallales bacterium]|nr:DUF3343 domain-containing protein [Victivallales bacterium]
MDTNYSNLLVFENTRGVILAEKECKKNGFKCLAVPVPRELSSQCGIALEIEESKKDEIIKLLKALGKPFKVFDKNNPTEFQNNKNCKL